MKVIDDLQLAVARKPESYVNFPVCAPRVRMSMTSFPCVPLRTGNSWLTPSTVRLAIRSLLIALSLLPSASFSLALSQDSTASAPSRSSVIISLQRAFGHGTLPLTIAHRGWSSQCSKSSKSASCSSSRRAKCRSRKRSRTRSSSNKARRHCQRSEEHTSELQSRPHLVCRLLLEKKKK